MSNDATLTTIGGVSYTSRVIYGSDQVQGGRRSAYHMKWQGVNPRPGSCLYVLPYVQY